MLSYKELSTRIENMLNDFPHFYAFNDEQFQEGLEKLKVTSKNDVASYGFGGYIRKSDIPEYKKLLDNIHQMKQDALKDFNYCVEAFEYELYNHECYYSGDITSAIYAVGLTFDEVKKSEFLSKAFAQAYNKYFKYMNNHQE